MPAATRHDALVDDLRDRLKRVEEMLEGITKSMARIEAAEEQQKQIANTWFSTTWPAHANEHKELEKKLGSLLDSRAQAQGAAKFAKFIWAGLAALGAYLLEHYLGGKTK